jgi:hypothetical protein
MEGIFQGMYEILGLKNEADFMFRFGCINSIGDAMMYDRELVISIVSFLKLVYYVSNIHTCAAAHNSKSGNAISLKLVLSLLFGDIYIYGLGLLLPLYSFG